MTTKALVVLSGGQDSTTCLHWACSYFDEVHALTFDYGQRHSREIQAAKQQAALAQVASHEIISMGAILKGTSPLTDPAAKLETYSDFASMDAIIGDRVELTFVPMRNALFLTLAANRAICLGINDIVTGVCQADNANYPDCRLDFILQQARTIEQGLGLPEGSFFIHTPLMHMSKMQSIQFAVGYGCYPMLAYTHTAYDGRYPPTGSDHASILRAHGFEQAGLPDPLVIRANMEGIMSLPSTSNYADPAICASVRAAVEVVVADLARLYSEED